MDDLRYRCFSVVVRRFVAEAPEKHPQLSAAELAGSRSGQPAVEEKPGKTPGLDLLRYRGGWAAVVADLSGMDLLWLRAIQLPVPGPAPGRRNRARPFPAAVPFLFLPGPLRLPLGSPTSATAVIKPRCFLPTTPIPTRSGWGPTIG